MTFAMRPQTAWSMAFVTLVAGVIAGTAFAPLVPPFVKSATVWLSMVILCAYIGWRQKHVNIVVHAAAAAMLAAAMHAVALLVRQVNSEILQDASLIPLVCILCAGAYCGALSNAFMPHVAENQGEAGHEQEGVSEKPATRTFSLGTAHLLVSIVVLMVGATLGATLASIIPTAVKSVAAWLIAVSICAAIGWLQEHKQATLHAATAALLGSSMVSIAALLRGAAPDAYSDETLLCVACITCSGAYLFMLLARIANLFPEDSETAE